MRLNVLLCLRLSALLLWLGMWPFLCLSVLLRLRLSALLLWLGMWPFLRLRVLLRLRLSVLLRLRLSVLLFLCLGVLFRLRLCMLPFLWLRLLLGALLLLLLLPRLWSWACRNDWGDRLAYCNRLCRRQNGRTASIHRGKLLVVLCCFVLVL